jgi:sporulation protein YlmC with PRC-barrel domain
MNEINVELLIGRKVCDANGRTIGRIEEIVAEEKGDGLFVSEYHVGTYGMMERFSVFHVGVGLLRFLGARGHAAKPKRIPWNELDLSDPEKPRWTSS